MSCHLKSRFFFTPYLIDIFLNKTKLLGFAILLLTFLVSLQDDADEREAAEGPVAVREQEHGARLLEHRQGLHGWRRGGGQKFMMSNDIFGSVTSL